MSVADIHSPIILCTYLPTHHFCSQKTRTTNGQVQGDQIGRFFGYWAIVYIGKSFENHTFSPKFRATVFHGKIYVLILTKTGWAIFSQTHLGPML
jgi:hypothetical protein